MCVTVTASSNQKLNQTVRNVVITGLTSAVSVTVILVGLVTSVNVTTGVQLRSPVARPMAFATTQGTAPAESVNVLKDTAEISANVTIRIAGAITGCFVEDQIVVDVTAVSVCVTPTTPERPVNASCPQLTAKTATGRSALVMENVNVVGASVRLVSGESFVTSAQVVQASVKITRTAPSVLHLVLECITPPSVKRCAPMSKLLLYWKLQPPRDKSSI